MNTALGAFTQMKTMLPRGDNLHLKKEQTELPGTKQRKAPIKLDSKQVVGYMERRTMVLDHLENIQDN